MYENSNKIGICSLEEKNSWNMIHNKNKGKGLLKEWNEYLFDVEAIQSTWDKVKQDDSKFYQKDFLPKHMNMIKKSPKAV